MDKQRDFYVESLTHIGYPVKSSWNLEQVEKLLFKCSTQRKKVLKKLASKLESRDKDNYTDEELLQVISNIVNIPKNLEKSFIEGVTPKQTQKKIWCSIFQELKHLSFVEPAKTISEDRCFDFLKNVVFDEKFPYDSAVEIFGIKEECQEKESTSVTEDLISELNKTIESTKVQMGISYPDETIAVPTFEKIDKLLKPLTDFNKRCKEKELKYGESMLSDLTSKLENFLEGVETINDLTSFEAEVNHLTDFILSNK